MSTLKSSPRYTFGMWKAGVPEPSELEYGKGDMLIWTEEQKEIWLRSGSINGVAPPIDNRPFGKRPFRPKDFLAKTRPPQEWTYEDALNDGWTRKQIQELDPFGEPLTANELASVNRLLSKSKWDIFPYGAWDEAGGAVVFFDRDYHPICRCRGWRSVEIVAPHQRISFVTETHFYGEKTRPDVCAATRMLLMMLMRTFQIEEELRERRRFPPHKRADDI